MNMQSCFSTPSPDKETILENTNHKVSIVDVHPPVTNVFNVLVFPAGKPSYFSKASFAFHLVSSYFASFPVFSSPAELPLYWTVAWKQSHSQERLFAHVLLSNNQRHNLPPFHKTVHFHEKSSSYNRALNVISATFSPTQQKTTTFWCFPPNYCIYPLNTCA